MRIEIPELAVVALIGVSGSGKSSFAARYFQPTEVLSSDYFRAMISDDIENQAVSADAFDALYYLANKRLSRGLSVVIDATNVQRDARAAVLHLAKEQDCQAVAIVLDMPEQLCNERNAQREDRRVTAQVVRRQAEQLRRSIRHLKKEGFRRIYVLKSAEEAADVEITRIPLWSNKKDESGPFDIIGDVHGCYGKLCELLEELGYAVDPNTQTATPPPTRKAIFLGDLCDRGPDNVQVLQLVMNMVEAGAAYCVAGNHEAKLLRKLRGADVKLNHGLADTVQQLETYVATSQDDSFMPRLESFLDGLISHYMLDGASLVVAHAGLKEKYHGRSSGRVRSFCLYGDTTGETDEYGLPVRLPWAREYRGKPLVVYGHTPTLEVEAVNNTYCIDTGCVFGGKLSALRYPERQVVQVDAAEAYYEPIKPLHIGATGPATPPPDDDMLNIDDVLGQRYLSTRLRRSIKINAENSAAALEVMSRFAADPHWLIYLPPTMSPCETSSLPTYLEYPTEAFDYYRKLGVDKVVCEQKHMGSRAVIVLCRDADVAAQRFKAADGSIGIIYTRTGRHFFEDGEVEAEILSRLQAVLTASGFWDYMDTSWVCLDTELMPWSAKAQALLEQQYAPVGRSGRSGLASVVEAIGQAADVLSEAAGGAAASKSANQAVDLPALLVNYQSRAEALDAYTEAYRRYCWEVTGTDDYCIAPFHILATEGKVWSSESHVWHMDTIARYMVGSDPIIMATDYLVVDLADENSIAAGVAWWEHLTDSGGEGMVVKPYDFIAMKGNETLQPAVKCRGREYLRIIYGPEYLLEGKLGRLKNRSLNRKRNLALNEFALGMESLERFVQGDALYRVHECVFGVLALESEPVDPRL